MVFKSTLSSGSYHEDISLTLTKYETIHSLLMSEILLFAVDIADSNRLKLVVNERLEFVHHLAKMEADVLSDAGIRR